MVFGTGLTHSTFELCIQTQATVYQNRFFSAAKSNISQIYYLEIKNKEGNFGWHVAMGNHAARKKQLK